MPMLGSNYLLDTNIIIGLFAQDNSIIDNIRSHSQLLSIPSIVIGELFYGAEQSSKRDFNVERIYSFAQDCLISECNFETAKHYASIKSHLKSICKPIPENDIWIAALARQHKQILVTRDKHFDNIENVTVERW
jgi:tRNA(fMet)-specific endonuclease VapC